MFYNDLRPTPLRVAKMRGKETRLFLNVQMSVKTHLKALISNFIDKINEVINFYL
jgi:hypothetical protein